MDSDTYDNNDHHIQDGDLVNIQENPSEHL